ncbi:EAL domain-containing protein [Blastomonas marina]|uniref:sensor domain-containing phosphodiesterase n=1 Tax=Blastomonas marina TaxID=1867408 RepID=UPI002AC9A685|nr:EAL domain-containing protein [Blastomonas marina]WPZ04935.1 EAL domain-containing protein [Blastomonas marina]
MNGDLHVALPDGAQPLRFEAIENDSIQRILKATRTHLGAEIAFVGRYIDGDRRELMYVDTELDLPMGPGFSEPREESFCWHILEGRLPELIRDAADHEFAKALPITEMLPVGCHLNVPLRLSNGEVFGSFCCLSRTADRSVSERDMDVLRAFGKLAGEMIETSLVRDEEANRLDRKICDVIAEGGISTYQQPIHDLSSLRVVGVESLSRFEDADRRSPEQWFEEAKSVGRGLELELAAIKSALDADSLAGSEAYISVNASPETVMSGEIARLLRHYSGRKVVIELTEHEQVSDFTALRDALGEIRQHARIAVDDVGAGYAGLRYLVDLAPDLLKLDMSLTREIHTDLARQAMAKAIVHFAKAIGADVIAEGIENAQELEMLKEIGVSYGQGYYFSKPIPAGDIPAYFAVHGHNAVAAS